MKRERSLYPDEAARSASQWHMRAEEIRTAAEDAHSPEVKAMMLRLAADFDRLAKHADGSALPSRPQ